MPHKLMIVKDGEDQGHPAFNIVDYYTAAGTTAATAATLNDCVVTTILAKIWNNGGYAPNYGGREHGEEGTGYCYYDGEDEGADGTPTNGTRVSFCLNDAGTDLMMARTIISDNSPPPQLPPQMMSMAIKLAKGIKEDGDGDFKLCIVPAAGYGNVVYYVEHGQYKGMQYLQNAGCSMLTAQGQSRAGCMCECQGFYKVNTRARHFKRYCSTPSAVAARNTMPAAPMNAAPLPPAPVPPRVNVHTTFPPMVCNILLSAARGTNCPVMLTPLEHGTECALLSCGHIISSDAYYGINASGRSKMCPICRDRNGWRHAQLSYMPAADLPPPPPAAPLPAAPLPPIVLHGVVNPTIEEV